MGNAHGRGCAWLAAEAAAENSTTPQPGQRLQHDCEGDAGLTQARASDGTLSDRRVFNHNPAAA